MVLKKLPVAVVEFLFMTPKIKLIEERFLKKFDLRPKIFKIMKRFFAFFVILIFILVGINIWWSQNSRPVSNEEVFKNFLITKGSSASKIAQELQEKGIIRNSLAFKFYVQLTGKAGKIQAGEYTLSPSFSLARLINEFIKGPSEVWVTIPEGFRREQIAEKFISGLDKKGEEAEVFRKEFLNLSKDKEGYLFPDTYLFPKGASASAVINKMVSIFNKLTDAKMRQDIAKGNYSLEQIVTMASLIERETKGEEEKPIVAGILYKRLGNGWPLQVDATIQYALAERECLREKIICKWWPTITPVDREINSRYNSYQFVGLPPTPIANPGLSSIKAAIYPTETHYWYYIHDEAGKIYYARTNEEHNQNIRKYLQ